MGCVCDSETGCTRIMEGSTRHGEKANSLAGITGALDVWCNLKILDNYDVFRCKMELTSGLR